MTESGSDLMPGAAAIPPTVAHALSEKNFQQQVVDLSAALGWTHFHNLHARGSDAGWPDLVLCRPPELLIVELKREAGELSTAQRQWLQRLEMCGVEVHVWKPSDFPAIVERLKR